MLTLLEEKTVKFILRFCCRNGLTLPFSWNKGRMVVNTERKILSSNIISWIILSITIIFQLIQIPSLINRKDVHGTILQGVMTHLYIAYCIIKINIWIFKEDIAELMNNILFINTSWGMTLNYVCNSLFC